MQTRFGLMLAALLLGGCATAPQQSVALSQEAVGPKAGHIGVAMTAMPKLDTQFPGADCLLCLAAASMMNASLTTHAHTLSYEDLPQLKNEVAKLLRKKGADVRVIEENLDVDGLPNFDGKGPTIARKDFSSMQQKYQIDRLLVIDITDLGFIRTYSAYVPTSDPKAQLKGKGYIVNLKSNAYDWYAPVTITKSADLSWDEPPKFPGLTNAYFQALELGKDDLLQPFAGEAVAAATPATANPQPVPVAAIAAPAQSAPQ